MKMKMNKVQLSEKFSNWLNNVSPETLTKVRRVVKVLREEEEIVGKSAFEVPVSYKFRMVFSDVEWIMRRFYDEGCVNVQHSKDNERMESLLSPNNKIQDNLYLKYGDTIITLILPKFILLEQMINERQAKQDLYRSDTKWFWIEEKTLYIGIRGGIPKSINLSTTKKQGADPYYLMLGLVELLKKKGICEESWLRANITQEQIKKEVQSHLEHKTIDDNWLKNTKANLKKNIPSDCEEYIEISDYKRKANYFTFGLKIPN